MTAPQFDFPSEFVIGLVSPVGSDNRAVQIALENGLKRFGYSVNNIRISDFLKRFSIGIDLPDEPQYDRISSRMKAGNQACREANRNDFLALVAVSEISKTRTIDPSTRVPVPDAMFLAYSASLRSADLSRQVGAAIVSSTGDVIGLGCNDVPRPGGGLYSPGRGDKRDYVLGYNSNERKRDDFTVDIVERLLPDTAPDQILAIGKKALKGSPVLDIIEFGRAVHAEMEAILPCVRTGTSAREATLYCTTFPCHKCTKHIIAAGIKRVVYIEPYPKSRAEDLHSDAIVVEEHGESSDRQNRKVRYQPFLGIGLRRYSDLFAMTLNSGKRIARTQEAERKQWERSGALPRVPMLPNSYLQRELIAIQDIETTMRNLEGEPDADQ